MQVSTDGILGTLVTKNPPHVLQGNMEGVALNAWKEDVKGKALQVIHEINDILFRINLWVSWSYQFQQGWTVWMAT